MTSPRQRRQQSRRKEKRPPGRYVSIAALALSVLSFLGAVAAPFLKALGIPFAVSGIASAVGFAAVWAALKNLREINESLNAKYSSPKDR
ncbi:hypothetical protein [Salinibacter altiplanensis]|uniref:hypothetical protein n=1 Tax=Salinibacter altiplanensis TaxID=1803181 RepID=UPI000C9EDFB5|nr:hypothetical protein [Salinibacter altiplanensis]